MALLVPHAASLRHLFRFLFLMYRHFLWLSFSRLYMAKNCPNRELAERKKEKNN